MNEYENMTKDELLTRCLFLEEVVKDRNEQIEKMKCCGNCIHFMYGYCMTDESCHINNEYKKWELATDEDNSEMTRDEEIERRR